MDRRSAQEAPQRQTGLPLSINDVQMVVSETEIHPTPYGPETNPVFEEGARLWLQGYTDKKKNKYDEKVWETKSEDNIHRLHSTNRDDREKQAMMGRGGNMVSRVLGRWHQLGQLDPPQTTTQTGATSAQPS